MNPALKAFLISTALFGAVFVYAFLFIHFAHAHEGGGVHHCHVDSNTAHRCH